MSFDVIIIGSGLAGSSAAIQLASRGFRVVLLEKKQYPTQKLCGEFLSTEVHGMLQRLGILETVYQADAHPIQRAVLSSSWGPSYTADLPGKALGLSRYCLDFLLFLRARELGAHCLDGASVRNVTGNLDAGFEVATHGETYRSRVVIGAFGKRSRLDGTLDRSFVDRIEPYVAFKAHYEGLRMPPQVEVHAFPGGYCGLAPIENGRVNVCWMAREELLTSVDGDIEQLIDTHLGKNEALRKRMAQLRRVSEKYEAVSQISLAEKTLFDRDVCMIGDAARMIAPLCGDGMAMALRSAEIAVPLAAAYLSEEITARQFMQKYTCSWKRRFEQRVKLGRRIQRTAMSPTAAFLAIQTCRVIPPLGRWVIRQTRGDGTSEVRGPGS